jgi:hypothetical protein
LRDGEQQQERDETEHLGVTSIVGEGEPSPGAMNAR